MDSLEGGGYIGNCIEASAGEEREEKEKERERERERERKAGVYDSVNR